jgi:NAD(P)H dehydrogenase (quinone)
VIDAAVQANIQSIVYTSTQGEKSLGKNNPEGAADMHALTEEAIKQSGLSYTILRNAPYMESLPMILGEKVLTDGYAMPMGNGKLSFATRQDMTIGSAKVLSTNEHDHKTYEFGGTVSVGFNEVMEILSELTGKKLEYHPIDPETYAQQSKEAGIPDMYILANMGFANQVKKGYFDHPTQDLANILEREPVSVEGFLKDTYRR